MSARAVGSANGSGNSDISPPALDFDDLPASQTVKWFAENPDLNPSKVNQFKIRSCRNWETDCFADTLPVLKSKAPIRIWLLLLHLVFAINPYHLLPGVRGHQDGVPVYGGGGQDRQTPARRPAEHHPQRALPGQRDGQPPPGWKNFPNQFILH